jgi:hypothetical protein
MYDLWRQLTVVTGRRSFVQNSPHLHKCRICLLIFCMFTSSAGVEGYRRRFSMRRILDRRVFSKFLSALPACFSVLMFHLDGHVNMWWNRKVFLKWYSIALLLARKVFVHDSVFHERVYGEHSMKTAGNHFNHSVCKIYTQGTVPCI